ncbi:MAG: phosphatidylglycerophosphatase A, partial [Verrucomicrobiota bacterium]
TLGSIGRAPYAPGTWGTLPGLLLYALAFVWLPLWAQIVGLVLLFFLGVWLTDRAEKELGLADPGCIVLDEAIAVPVCFLGLAASTPTRFILLLAAAFALFRLFDALKPPPIRQIQHLPGGWGCCIDDLLAALATCACLHAIGLVVPW